MQTSFRVAEFNVENLFIFLDHYRGEDLRTLSEEQWQRLSASTIPNKPLRKVREIARAIRDLDADFYMLCEVGGLESLENFNRYFLNDTYRVHLIEGNSDRGIDLGYLVRKDLPYKYDLISHRNRSLDFLYPHEQQSNKYFYNDPGRTPIPSHKFSRDVLELRVFSSAEVEGRTDPAGNSFPELILLLVHLKSQLDRERIDPYGRDRRRAENEKLMQIYNEIAAEFSQQVPIIVGGDFNGQAGLPEPDPEFTSIYQNTDLKDCLDVADVPVADRFTFIQVGPGGRQNFRRLDFLFLSSALQVRLDPRKTGVYLFKDQFDMALPLPRTLAAKQLLPSDHYPVYATFTATGILG